MIYYISSQADGLFIFAYSSKNETKILRLVRAVCKLVCNNAEHSKIQFY